LVFRGITTLDALLGGIIASTVVPRTLFACPDSRLGTLAGISGCLVINVGAALWLHRS